MANNLFKIQHTALPQRVRDILNIEDVDNFSLKLNKCANFLDKKENQRFNNADLSTLNDSLIKDKKAYFYINKYGKQDSGFYELWVNPKIGENTVKQCHEDVEKALNICSHTQSMIFKLNWRLAIGLGASSVFENGLTLHHVYGVPYIPASSIKGIINHYLQDIKEDKTDNYKTIFGDEKQEGKIIFFDAFPTEITENSIQPDIMNNHYQEYYNGDSSPSDWLSPNPVIFLTLKGINFRFNFGVIDNHCKELLPRIEEYLENALKEKGIGGKTAVGYGFMNRNEPIVPKPAFLQKGNLNLKKRHQMEGVITKSGIPNYASIYVQEGIIQENVKIDLLRSPHLIGTIVKVEVEINKQGKVVQASYKADK